MKILVTVKRVEDPEIKIKINADGSGIDTDQMKYVVNPFDEIAVEEALRLRDSAGGEVIIASIGHEDGAHQIRTALAMGADRGVHVIGDQALDTWTTSEILMKVIEDEKPDIVLLGKQAVDDDQGQVGSVLAERLGWGQVTFASKEASLESDEEKNKTAAFKADEASIEIVREVDGGVETLRVKLPAIVTTELRLNVPRYASLPGIMKAKKKEIKQLQIADLLGDASTRLKVTKMEAPTQRKAGVIVPDVATLVDKLRNEAKAL